MDPHGQVWQLFAKAEQLSQAFLELLEISRNTADEIVFLAHPVQGQVDDQLTLRTGFGNTLDAIRNAGEDGIRRNVDDPGLAMLVGRLGQLDDMRIHQWFAAADREPVRRLPQGSQDLVPLIDGKFVLALYPDIAGDAARIALRRRRQSEVQGKQARPPEPAI